MSDKLEQMKKAIKHTFPTDKKHINYIGHHFSLLLNPNGIKGVEFGERKEWNGIYGYKILFENCSHEEQNELINYIFLLPSKNLK